MMGEFAQRLAPLSLRFADSSAMMMIAANPGITASALGRMLDIQRANMVPLLNRLASKGLIEKVPLDGKSMAIVLSAAGRDKLAEVRAITERFESDLLRRIPAAHRSHFVPALNALWR